MRQDALPVHHDAKGYRHAASNLSVYYTYNSLRRTKSASSAGAASVFIMRKVCESGECCQPPRRGNQLQQKVYTGDDCIAREGAGGRECCSGPLQVQPDWLNTSVTTAMFEDTAGLAAARSAITHGCRWFLSGTTRVASLLCACTLALYYCSDSS